MAEEEKKLQSVLKQLEKVVEDLSGKDVDVEAGLEKFKEGVSLIKFCREKLQKAENEFEKIKSELEVEENGEEKDDFREETQN